MASTELVKVATGALNKKKKKHSKYSYFFNQFLHIQSCVFHIDRKLIMKAQHKKINLKNLK